MSENIHPDTNPFDLAYRNICKVSTPPTVLQSLVDVADTVDMAKRILLQNRVRQFTATDVVALTALILDRENELFRRQQENEE